MPESNENLITETHTSMEDGSITVVCSAVAKTGCPVGCAYTIAPHEASLPIEDRPDARRSCSAAHESIRTKIAELEAVETDEPRTDHTTHEHAIQRFKHEDTAQFRDRIASITGQDPGIAAEITRPTFTPMQTLEERAAKYGQPTIQYPDIFKLPE